MKYWFVSDTHFGHANIIKYVNRPFKTLDDMNSTIIKNFNSRVKEDDLTFFVGDFCFKNTPNKVYRGEGEISNATYYANQLNGDKIFIRGSHDSNNSCKTCIRNIKIKLGGKVINIVHDPKYINYNVDFNIVGHVHNLWKVKKFFNGHKTTYAVNVGVDVSNFYPLSIEEILARLAAFQKEEKRGKKIENTKVPILQKET